MRTTTATARGRSIAATLAGAWRADLGAQSVDAPVDATALADMSSLLLLSGSAPLAWRRLRHTALRDTPASLDLQQAYRGHALQSAVDDQMLMRLLRFLHAAGIEPILAKGWAIARRYPETALRPYGDVDLFVHPATHAAVDALVRRPDTPPARVDLHHGATELSDRAFETLQARSALARLDDVSVRVFGAEDHLRLLCLHMLRHGAWRPLWLADVAVAFESRPVDFDWPYFMSGDPRQTEWTVAAIAVAHHLLGAEVRGTPVEARTARLPRWLIPAVLEQWGRGKPLPQEGRRIRSYLRDRTGLLEALRTRWPNAIQATVSMHGPFNDGPRWLFQGADCLRRAGVFVHDCLVRTPDASR